MQRCFLAVDHQSMTGIVAALEPRHHRRLIS